MMSKAFSICAYLGASVIALVSGGCWKIYPPDPATLKEPVPVYVADYGEHSAVLLPQSPEVYVEYSFGDYAYSALNYDTDLNAIAALFISMQSSLGRTFTPKEPNEPYPWTVRRPVRVSQIWAEKAKVAAVVKEMDERYQNAKTKPLFNPENSAYFVKDRYHYSLFNNCNHLTSRILRKLDCRSSGIVYIADFSMQEPKTIVQPTQKPSED